MGTHPIFESDFDCLTDFRNGYIPGLSPQTSRYRWQTAPDSQEAQVRVWPTGVYDETGAAECSLCSNARWKHQIPSAPTRSGFVLVGDRGDWPQSAHHRRCLQRVKQRIGANQDAGQGRHRDNRFHPLPPVVRVALRRKKNAKLTEEEEQAINGKKSASAQKKFDERKKTAEVSAQLVEQFQQGRLIARIASRPGQCGRADGYILEGKELEFYARKLKAKKTK